MRREIYLGLLVATWLPGAARADEAALEARRDRAVALVESGPSRAAEALREFAALVEAQGGEAKAPARDRLGLGLAAQYTKDAERAERVLGALAAAGEGAGVPRDVARAARYGLVLLRADVSGPAAALETLAPLAGAADAPPEAIYQSAVLRQRLSEGTTDAQSRDDALTAARAALERLVALGPGDTGAGMYHDPALYRLAMLLVRAGEREKGRELLRTFQDRRKAGLSEEVPDDRLALGSLLDALRPPEAAAEPAALVARGIPGPELVRIEAVEGARSPVLACDLDGDGLPEVLVGGGGDGALHVLANKGGGRFELAARLADVKPAALAAGDIDNDGLTDVIAGGRLLRNRGKLALAADEYRRPSGEVVKASGLDPGGDIGKVIAFDYDHDGDLDVACLAGSKLTIRRNLSDGRFEAIDVADGVSDFALCDPDDDVDLDIVVALRGGELRVLCNRRMGSYAAPRPVRAEERRGLPFPFGRAVPHPAPAYDDLDLDGVPEILARGEVADLDGDGRPDVLLVDHQGLGVWWNRLPDAGRPVRVRLAGQRTNRSAVGAWVEARAGAAAPRRALTRPGLPVILGIGAGEDAARVDLVRVRWPNGVRHAVQVALDPEPGGPGAAPREIVLEEPKPIGSCPFLYAWNGERFAFVTDINGAGGVGLPGPEGFVFPVDWDEWVFIDGARLRPRDGRYELRITEELSELTYIDDVKLFALDHPEGTLALPNEAFRFDPTPPFHVYCVRDGRPPARAETHDGRDVTDALAREDGRYVAGLRELGGQFLGIAEPHAVVLDFDVGEMAREARPVLFLTGFLRWSEPQTNVAAQQCPPLRPRGVRLLVAGPDGGFGPLLEDCGYPSGRQKTAVVDLAGLLPPGAAPGGRLRLRLETNRAIYWDRIALSTAPRDEPLALVAAPLLAAESRHHGISAYRYPEPDGSSYEDHFYEQVLPDPPFEKARGLHTRYGDVLELVRAIDDRFAIISGGDEVALAFDARSLPPPPAGWRRDFLLRFEGVCKGADLNAVPTPDVEPLPFHGMSGYPYARPDERYPDDDLHLLYRAFWLTRPGP